MSTNTAVFGWKRSLPGRQLSSEAWTDHMVRAMIHLEEPVLVRAVSGSLVQERMSKWSACIPG